MKKYLVYLFVFVVACSPKQGSVRNSENKLKGNWCFLDGRGNYNEAYFSDSTYVTYNGKYGIAPAYKYVLKKDSLYSNVDRRKKGLNRIAKIAWLQDKMVFITEFSRDTLERIETDGMTLAKMNPKKDSAKFNRDFNNRYENFLVKKGILSEDEIEQFKQDKKVPEDVLEKLKK